MHFHYNTLIYDLCPFIMILLKLGCWNDDVATNLFIAFSLPLFFYLRVVERSENYFKSDIFFICDNAFPLNTGFCSVWQRLLLCPQVNTQTQKMRGWTL